MTNNIAQLQQMTDSCCRPAKVLAIASGKGGVGKTNIAANLGLCLAACGKRVLLLDADMALGNLDLVLNVTTRYNISHLLSARKSIDEIIYTAPEGLELISGASGLQDMANLSEFPRRRLLAELTSLQQNRDIIIIDTAAGISKSVIGFCLAADHSLIVTTPEPTAMTDAYAMIKVLVANDCSGRISLLVNMASNYREARDTYRQISSVAKRFLDVHIYDAGALLADAALPAALKMRQPVALAFPKAKITLSLAALAAKLSTPTNVKMSSEGFFRKVVDRFF